MLSFCAFFAPRNGGKLPEGLNSDSLARNAAVRALQLDSTSAEAHIQMGIVRYSMDEDYAAAGPHLKRAVELNPGLANAHREFSLYLLRMGQTDAAERYALEAMRLNPASAASASRHGLGYIELVRGNYEKAREHLRQTLVLLPDNRWAARDLGLVYAEMDRLDAAFRTIRRAELSALRRLTYSGLAYARAGRRDSARAALERLRRQFDDPSAEAQIHAALGETDLAINLLEKVNFANRPFHYSLKGPAFEPLEDDPRFQSFLERFGLDDETVRQTMEAIGEPYK